MTLKDRKKKRSSHLKKKHLKKRDKLKKLLSNLKKKRLRVLAEEVEKALLGAL